MKRKILLLLFVNFCFANALFSNDTVIQHSSGGNEYIISKSNAISIESEILEITLCEKYYHVAVDYVFRNDGATEKLSVGFPMTEYDYFTKDINEHDKLRNFKTTVDNVMQKYNVEEADISIGKNENEAIKKFYVKDVIFGSQQKTYVHVEYDTSYNKNTGGSSYCIADYLLGSAISWKGIERLQMRVIFDYDNFFLDEFNFEGLVDNNLPVKTKVAKDGKSRILEAVYENLNLDLSTKVHLYLHNDEYDVFGLPWDYNFGFVEYPKHIMELLTPSQLRKARNLIYAFHGYKFRNEDLSEFFNRFSWYNPNNNFSENLFNEIEKKNLKLIIEIENERK